MIKVLVTGDRKWTDENWVFREIVKVSQSYGEKFFVIHGDASGADAAARAACHSLRIPQLIAPAKWNKYRNGAGPIRNRWMLSVLLEASALNASLSNVLVLAFHDQLAKSAGTLDMVCLCLEEGISVVHYYHDQTGEERDRVLRDVSEV